jgi:hypothetical protein
MAVDQARAEKVAPHIDGLPGRIVSETDNHTSKDGNVLFLNVAREDIHNPSVFDQNVSLSLARRNPNPIFRCGHGFSASYKFHIKSAAPYQENLVKAVKNPFGSLVGTSRIRDYADLS